MNHQLQDKIKAKMSELSQDKHLPCAKALALANELNVPPKTIGEIANQLKIKITNCQLGCF